MDEKQHIETIDDIQDALASMVAVEPSPEFAARVRQRIAGGVQPREWRGEHLVLPALATAAVLVLSGLLIVSETRRVAPERAISGMATRDGEPATGISRPPPEPSASEVPPQAELAALVPRNEVVAVERLLSAAQAGRFEFELVPAAVPVATELSAPGPISVPPIELILFGNNSSLE
jgi:hypothetical protein